MKMFFGDKDQELFGYRRGIKTQSFSTKGRVKEEGRTI